MILENDSIITIVAPVRYGRRGAGCLSRGKWQVKEWVYHRGGGCVMIENLKTHTIHKVHHSVFTRIDKRFNYENKSTD